jgi:DNA-directed RNA polymerase subunit F
LDLEAGKGITSLKRLLRKKETIYENIKDLEFEYKMGKLSDEDFLRLRNDLSREAYEVMTQIDAIQPETLQKPGQPQVVAILKSEESPKS